MNDRLKEILKMLPELPGCYIYYNADNEIIYVGKAKILKRRVKSYFNRKHHDSVKVNVLVSQIDHLEYIITNTEVEALILESHLIKKHKPKYNILLKDDKKYPYFLVTDEDFPRILIVRKRNINKLKGRYYGPYTNIGAMHSTLDFLKKIFPLRQCKTPRFKSRPCLYYSIGKCLAPCQGLVSSKEYKAVVHQAELFLSGKQGELLKQLKEQIQKYSDAEQFEKAAKLRDSYLDLTKTLEKQKVVYENTKLNEDIISLAHEDGILVIVIMMIREGRLIDKKDFSYEAEEEDKIEYFETFFKEYYSTLALEFPDRIVSDVLEQVGNKSLYEQWLEVISGKKVKISYGKSAQGKELQKLADKNAAVILNNKKLSKMSKINEDFNLIGSYLKETLHLNNFPYRMECYDISHIQGTNTVASMVVFINGLPKKSEYKKFKIKSTEGKPDDFLSMKEVLTRRLNHLGDKGWDKPDLIIIDGGKGQLSSVMEIVEDMGIKDIDFVSLAKRQEEVFLPHKSESIILPRESGALFLIQRIRDEAHRFAITYHRKLRNKNSIKE
ncbi:MAG: excinuclease ABC subunit UvrC [Cyanobacteriota bacterium]|nr:excinuclease ABC subunit UvrC [Cyanobacteriota bacterium]MDY6358155.1 excinuclease ABC subunit UvrC [Cyanobacteriota bacterium]MDY6364443.1 excinuclease ABC subunit UvrC [Cyanobacteriota bacterium]